MILKTNTFNNRKYFSILTVLFLFMCSSTLIAQVTQKGTLYVKDNGIFSVKSTSFNFGITLPVSTTATSRTNATFGKIFLSPNTTNNATDDHHVNGYVRSFGDLDFIYPIGNGTKLAPARIQTANLAANFDCAYYGANPSTIGVIKSSYLDAISAIEYWDMQSTSSATLSLTWNSNISALTPGISLDNVTIAAFDGIKWVVIPSTVDALYLGSGGASSLLTSGSVTSSAVVDFSIYSKFTIGAKGACLSAITTGLTPAVTWNGAWSNGTGPLATSPVTINSAYNGGSFVCNSLVLNADVTLGDSEYVEIENGVTGPGKIIMSSTSSVIQKSDSSDRPNIEMTKTRQSLRRYDYVYFGTPVVGNILGQMATAQAVGAATANAFDLYYQYNTGSNGGWTSITSTVPGKGFIARVKQAAPFTNATNTADVSVVISGIANNGTIAATGVNSPDEIDNGTDYLLLGNPYPSAIDANKFIDQNTDLYGTLYVWTSQTTPVNTTNTAINYSQTDYIQYNKTGIVYPSGFTNTFNGKIATGQGFRVGIIPNATTPTNQVTASYEFNNCMRVKDNNTNLYRSNTQQNTVSTIDRFKLNMIGNNNVFSQILIGYLPEATYEYDRLYDGARNSASTAQLYSIFEGDGRKLGINGRPTFVNTDEVPVGISKNNNNVETFVISISDKEGVFTNPNVNVYLHDKVTNEYHNFNTGDFTFTTNESQVNDRFTIVYQTNALSNTDFTLPEVSALLNDNLISVKSASVIKNIQVYDVTGRLVENYNSIDTNTFEGKFNHEESIYIAKINFDNGAIVSKKLIHTKR